jgi:glycosyltransferase involved in cell wall biosynthesis
MKLNLNGPLNKLSYGYVTWNILNQLTKMGHEVSFFPVGGWQNTEVDGRAYPDYQSVINAANQRAIDFSHPKLDTVRIFHQFSMAESIGAGKRIGFPIFELDRFTTQEKNHLRSLDGIWVTSNWGKGVVENEVPGIPCKVIPLGYDPDIFFPNRLFPAQSDTFVVGNIGKLEHRKGHGEIVEIFNAAFEKTDDVELWLGLDSFHINKTELDNFVKTSKESKLGDKIRFIPRMDSQVDVAEIINCFDVGLFPSRAEGWNLELLECLACDIPCVATDYSAHTEFCRADEVYLVKPEFMELAHDGRWFFSKGYWAQINKEEKDQFVDHIRYLYKNRDPNYSSTHAKTYTWEVTCLGILEELSL